jgi:hypothetical protein
MKKQNPMAKEVRTPKYKQRIVKDKTIYDRKKTSMNEILEVCSCKIGRACPCEKIKNK